jgi:regulatory protein
MMTYEQALSRMAALCSTSEHCESDIRQKLAKAAMPPADIERIVTYLYDNAYLDTARYCNAYASDQLRFAHWGRMKIAQALRIKGLPQTDISEALDLLPEEAYASVLHDLLRQKARTLHDEDEYTRRAKLMRYAAGRGFTANEIIDAMDSVNIN